MTATQTVDIGPGRLEPRRLTASTVLVGYRDGTGLPQVFHIERDVTMKASRVQRYDMADRVTSLRPERAGP